jgi:hypothetical protein
VIYDTYLSGIALEIVDGGIMELININNITMNRVNNPLFIKLGNRARKFREDMEKPGIGTIQHLQISNIQATEVGEFTEIPDVEFSHHKALPKAAAIFIDGLPEKQIKNIRLENFIINYDGGGSREDALAEVPFNTAGYPEYTSYGEVRPAYGFYCRNVMNLSLKHIKVTFEKPDHRPAYIFSNVNRLLMEHIEGERAEPAQYLVQLIRCKECYLESTPFSIRKKDIYLDQFSELLYKHQDF